MISSNTLLSIGKFDLKLHHLLIIGILVLSFSVSFLLRSQPASYGWELHEFDPFFNYRATQYLLENGINEYFQWNDELSWYPHGRNVSETSQVMLHLTGALTYWVFGSDIELYDFTILFPVVFGSLTTVVIFALVRVIGGTTAGLFSAMLFSISLPILIRGTIGWFKSEPLGLFFGLLGIYFFLSGINSKNKKIAFGKLISAGILLPLAISAWGGSNYFIIPLGIFFLSLPFLRTDHKFLLWALPIFTIITLLTSLAFERLSLSFIFGLGGFTLIFPTLFVIACIFIQSKSNEKNKIRNGLIFLCIILGLIIAFFVINDDSNIIELPSYRYLNAVNPFLTTTNPLVDSIQEHSTTTLDESFFFHSILMIFSGLGIWLLLKNTLLKKSNFIKNDMLSFSLIIGLLGVYISSAFIRLEVFASLSMIILSSLGLSVLLKIVFKIKPKESKIKNISIKTSYVIGIVILLTIPLVYPANSLITVVDHPPTILNGGTYHDVATSDWLDAMEWIKNNTPKDAVFASWWDYGYWISTMGERATISDNSTIMSNVITNIAKTFLSSPEDGWMMLQDMEADYVLVFVSGELLHTNFEYPIYMLEGGGDESKMPWFMHIAEVPLSTYLHPDDISGNDYFWNETLLGKMFPFIPFVYLDPLTEDQYLQYEYGLWPVYLKEIEYPPDGDGPLRLVYASPSYTEEKVGPMIAVFVYEVNKDFSPNI